MKEEKVSAVISAIQRRVPSEKLVVIKNKLADVSDEKFDDVMSLSLKSPTTVLLLSIFLGGLGVDRFVVGDVGLGIAKLLFGWLTWFIWPFIDIFFSYRKAKEKNFDKIMLHL